MKKQILIFLLYTFSSLQAQIPTAGLVAYYSFSGNADETTGVSNNGTVVGASLTTDRFGAADSAYAFNGSSNYIKLNNDFDFLPRTTSIWFNANIDSVYRVIYSSDNKNLTKGMNTLAVQKLNGVNKLIYVACGIDDTTDVTPNTWHHAVIVVDTGNRADLYLDCKKIASINYPTFYHSLDVTNKASIGTSRGYNNRFFSGKIDDLRIYSRALNSNELNELCKEGNTSTAIEEKTAARIEINIYPNPSSNILFIDFENEMKGGKYTYQLVNQLSQVVYSGALDALRNQIQLDEATQSGIYYLMIYDANNGLMQVKKILIQN